jgi:hypothetical protein
MFSEKMLQVFKDIKTTFDSGNILNPGKKVGYTKEYLREHVAVEK